MIVIRRGPVRDLDGLFADCSDFTMIVKRRRPALSGKIDATLALFWPYSPRFIEAGKVFNFCGLWELMS